MNSVTVDNVFGQDPDMVEVARLPGEGVGYAGSSSIGEETLEEAPDMLGTNQRAAARKAGKNNLPLYAGVGLLALLMAGGYVYLQPAISHHQVQTKQAATVAPSGAPPAIAPLAPSAALANVPLPHLPPAVVHQKYIPQPPSTELSELDSYRAGAPGINRAIPQPLAAMGTGEIAGQNRPALQASARPHTPAGIAAPVSRHGPPSDLLTAQPQATAHNPPAGAAVAPASPGGPAAAVNPSAQKPPFVVATAVRINPGAPPTHVAKPTIAAVPNSLPAPPATAGAPGTGASLAAAQAGALSPAQQTSLYQLVTQLGTLERNDEIRQAVLAGQVQQLTLLLSGKMADYDRRLSMLEAQTAVTGAVQAASNTTVAAAIAAAPPAAAPATVSSPPVLSSAPAAGAAIPASPPSNGPAAAVQYHVQAASPGLAMLSAVGGNGSPLEVQTGDIIPGYGKVLGVVQQGDSWVVQTQSGNIE